MALQEPAQKTEAVGRRRPAQGHKSTQEDRYLEVVYILYIHIQ